MKKRGRRRGWVNPMLTILLREGPEKTVLASCKGAPITGVQPTYTGCKSQPSVDFTYCETICWDATPS
ncbi:MAG: hypothetical protein PHT31_07605 [Candidatus Omnitrophica bacterium]|nr:hypothetical protein [Candidatus Omnitrophota bacterium]MDD5654005.1 hypothetical protein [Candidatus Omnitrophota bacterium]